MRTGNDCLVCFLRQTLATVRRCTDDPQRQRQIITEVGSMLADFDQALPPPENAVHYYRLIAERTPTREKSFRTPALNSSAPRM